MSFFELFLWLSEDGKKEEDQFWDTQKKDMKIVGVIFVFPVFFFLFFVFPYFCLFSLTSLTSLSRIVGLGILRRIYLRFKGMCPDFCLFVFLSFCLFVLLSFCLFVFLSFCLFVFLPFCLFVFCLFNLSSNLSQTVGLSTRGK